MHLPAETLLMIFRELCSHCRNEPISLCEEEARQVSLDSGATHTAGYHTLASLCRVSKRFYGLAQPFLYHEFVVGYQVPANESPTQWNGQLLCYMRTLMARRDLAALVKRAFISPRLLLSFGEEDAVLKAILAACRVLHAEVEHLKREKLDEDKLYYALVRIIRMHEISDIYEVAEPLKSHLTRQCLGRNLLAAAIALLPNLEHLALQVDKKNIWPRSDVAKFPFRLMMRAKLPIKVFETTLCMSRCLGILEAAANIETLHISGTLRYPPSTALKLPHLKTLRITKSMPSLEILQNIFATCKHTLETFIYETRYPPTVVSGFVFDIRSFLEQTVEVPMALMSTLLEECTALKTLHLDYRLCRDHRISSFQNLQSVKHLTIGVFSLIDAMPIVPVDPPFNDNLPPFLETLSFTAFSHVPGTHRIECVSDAIKSLSHARKSHPPRFSTLKRVVFGRECQGDVALAAAGDTLVSQGVEFGYESWPLVLRPQEVTIPMLGSQVRFL